MTVLDVMVDESLDVLRRAREKYRRVWVNFSGGKDSLVVLDLASQVFNPGEMKIVFIEVTGNTDKCNTEYVRRVHEKYYGEYELVHVRPSFDFFELMVRNGIPNPVARWCMDKYKIQYLRRLSPPFHIVGVKRSDSRKRSATYVKHVQRLKYGGIGIFPILSWTTTDVYDYIKQYGLELSPCYKRYGHSGNCMFCPFMSKKQASRVLQDPYWRGKIIGALRQIRSLSDKNNRSGFKRRIIRYWLNNPVLHSRPITEYLAL